MKPASRRKATLARRPSPAGYRALCATTLLEPSEARDLELLVEAHALYGIENYVGALLSGAVRDRIKVYRGELFRLKAHRQLTGRGAK